MPSTKYKPTKTAIRKMLITRRRNMKLRAKGINVPSKYKPRKTQAITQVLEQVNAAMSRQNPDPSLVKLAEFVVAVWRAM